MEIEFSDQALKNIENMHQRCHLIENEYGPLHGYTMTARDTLLHALTTIFRWGGKITAEDDLSLIINSSITIGVIWHPRRQGNERDPLVGTWSCHS